MFRGDRVIIPRSLRKEMLSDLHSAHQGLESMTRRARETIHWPHMNQELKDYLSACTTCDSYRDKQAKEPLIPHEVPDRAWAKVACDLFEFDQKVYLVTVDYYSYFFEVDRLDTLTAKAVIRKLKPHIARYGIPQTLVTDNGPQFISREFNDFATKYGIQHTKTSPYHHQSNGKVESAVKQAKKILRVCKSSGDDVFLALLAVRNTPQVVHDTSPAQRLFNRRTNTQLPIVEKLLQPEINDKAKECIQKRQDLQRRYYDRGARDLSPLQEGEMVRIQPVHKGQRKWKKGKVIRQTGVRSYEVESDGRRYKRNRRFLRRSSKAASDNARESDEESVASGFSEEEAEGETEAPENSNAERPATEASHSQRPSTPAKARLANTTRSGRIVRKPQRLGYQ